MVCLDEEGNVRGKTERKERGRNRNE